MFLVRKVKLSKDEINFDLDEDLFGLNDFIEKILRDLFILLFRLKLECSNR